MQNLIIIGAGGHAAEIDDYINHSRTLAKTMEIKIAGFLDDDIANYSRYKFSAPYLGRIKNHQIIQGHKYIIAIANLKFRRLLVNQFKSLGAEFITFIHHTAFISESANIGEGSIIGPNVNLGPNVQIGDFTLINSRCSIGHDSIVGDYNFISPNVCFSGFTRVGSDNLFGINAVTIPGISVGNRNKIAAGMVLDQNVGDDAVVFYRFKEKVIAVPKS